MFIFRRLFGTAVSPQIMDAAKTKAQGIINDNAVAVFSKSYCPYCKQTKSLLDSMGAKYYAIELDNESDGSAIQSALEDISGQRTVPNVFINKKHVGGNSDLQAKNSGGQLKSLLTEAGAL
ncbi:putative glutaredoxin [Xylariomycetidae sp. FL0641]|nr:putative glutaredoxin [Xylariomycetidae sp. FL0641]